MLPEALFNTYRQYKSDTTRIVSWLVATATKCGYTASWLSTEAPKPTKLKGRARKLARDAAAAEAAALKRGESPSPAASKREAEEESKPHVVQLKEFVPMATAIAKSAEQTSRISTGMIRLFKRCIEARAGVGEWYKAIDEDDGTHGHVVDVLQRTLQVLIPVHELQELDKRHFRLSKMAGAEGDGSRLSVQNAFGQLEIEDMDEDALAAVPDAMNTTSGEGKRSVKYEVEEDPDEFFWGLDCLFTDIHDLLDFVKSTWERYLLGKMDVASAAVATNTAIDLVKRAEQGFLAETKSSSMWQRLGKGGHPCLYQFSECCIRAGETQPPRMSGEILVPLELWDQVEESLLLPFRLVGINSGKMIHITRAGWLGTYNPKLDLETASPKQLYEQDTALMADMFATLRPLVRFHQTPNDDELMKGLYENMTTGEAPLYLVFACKVFVEIHHVLKTKSTKPFRDLTSFALEARRTLRGHQKYMEKHGLVGNRSQRSDVRTVKLLNEIEEWVLNDKILDILNKNVGLKQQRKSAIRSPNPKLDKVRVWKEDEVLKMSPLLCGMWKYAFQLQMQQEGLALINESQTMIAAHLYNALQVGGFLDKDCSWKDAEYLLDIHSEADPFLGERPTTIEDCMRRLALTQGVSPETFAPNRRPSGRRIVMSKNSRRYLQESTPVAGLFWDRFLGKGDLNLEKLKAILEPRARERRIMSRDKVREVTKKMLLEARENKEWEDIEGDDSEVVRDEMAGEDGAAAADTNEVVSDDASDDTYDSELEAFLDGFENRKPIDLVEFSETLSITLQYEKQDLDFDYFAFHQSTWRLLTAIQEKCLPYLLPWVTHEEVKDILRTAEGVTLVPQALMALVADPEKDAKVMMTKGALASTPFLTRQDPNPRDRNFAD